MIDLGAVRAALGRLDTLAARGDLTTPEAQARLDRWLAQQEQEEPMPRPPAGETPRSKNLFVRVEPETIERLDALRTRLSARFSGMTVTRADVIRRLLHEGLDRYEQEED